MNVEKAARKELRMMKQKPEELQLALNGTQASIVAKHLLKSIFPERELKGKIKLSPISRDELNSQFFTDYLEDRKTDFESNYFLSTISYHDLKEYAKKNKLETKDLVLGEKETEVHELLSELQDDQQQTMSSLRKTYGWMKEALKKNK